MQARRTQRFVCIVDGDGKPQGCGFAIEPRRILTCAHVISSFVPSARDGRKPREPVAFVLPFSENPFDGKARVALWWPGDQYRGALGRPIEDIAVLETDYDLPVGDDLTLIDIEGTVPNLTFSAYGYPAGKNDDGAYAYGLIRDVIGGGWTQLDQDGTGVVIQPGFSGGPVWSDQFDGVVGMAVGYDHRTNTRHSKMIPVRVLAEAIPELRTRVRTQRLRARAPNSQPPSLLIHLCDRQPQIDALTTWSKQQRDRHAPAVFVLEGSDLECHSGFVERLAGDLLPPILSCNGNVPLVEIDWPITAYRDGVLSRSAPEILEKEIRALRELRSNAPVMISSSILTREWRDGGKAAIELFGKFWAARRFDEPRDFIGCLGVRYAEPSSRFPWFDPIERGVRSASAAVKSLGKNDPSFLVFPPLEPVIRTWVTKWAKDARVSEWTTMSEEHVTAAYERVPREKWRKGAIPMGYLAEELSALLRVS